MDSSGRFRACRRHGCPRPSTQPAQGIVTRRAETPEDRPLGRSRRSRDAPKPTKSSVTKRNAVAILAVAYALGGCAPEAESNAAEAGEAPQATCDVEQATRPLAAPLNETSGL